MKLDERVRAGIRELGFTTPTEIQKRKYLPYTLSGYDLIGQAQTGTGKTAAFLITILTASSPMRGRTAPSRGR